MKKKNCPFQEKVNAFLDRELDSAEYKEMQKHTLSCSICQQEIRELNRINCSLADWADEDVPSKLYARILADTDKITSRGHVKLWRAFSNLSIAASILFAFFMGVLLSNNSFGNSNFSDASESSYEVAFDSYSMLSYLGEE